MTEIALREATFDDAELLHEWRNDPTTREQSFSRDEVDQTTHRRWLSAKLAARDHTRIWIVTAEGNDVGQIRYEKREGFAEISFSVDARFRGRGMGRRMLEVSAARACRELGVNEVRGLVKLTNAASLAVFERAGFQRSADTIVNRETAAVFIRKCWGSSELP